jgi:uncharacterized protein YsxB (DUF464 family)
MIKANFFKDSQGRYRGFSLLGHAGYAKAGEDIVCASVSALSINTVNSIEKFTKDVITSSVDEETGMLTCSFEGTVSDESTLLVNSLLFGLEQIAKDYADDTYIKISIKEV